MKLEYARLNNGNVPNIGQLAINLGFTEKQVSINKFRGDLGGGTLNLAGKVLLPKLNEPAFDLQIKSDKILVKRDDSVTVRVDTDLGINGPLAGGKIAGTVYVTQSRFFKEIDILPIALPGRPKPKARPAPKSVARAGDHLAAAAAGQMDLRHRDQDAAAGPVSRPRQSRQRRGGGRPEVRRDRRRAVPRGTGPRR